ncbi:hypothetical protein DAPPUDRAFT_268252 [Daphnia pulex]|uniref:Uncharacterized protein n=1 Tax=Daphnia pulex TaxID=6669 RepID=E9HXH8_DAPPU|nr:hypothetical protein DAPPUDRAFT_268252 [Daphnia pulex]|eukprot:EFX63550.1 hypothetical protein DAPPUDRAFT_268252 [Daphnia pulex]
MSGNRQAATVQLEWQFAAGTDFLSRVDLAGLNASQYCDLFADLETKECIRNLQIAFVRAQQVPVQTRTIYFNIPPETVALDYDNNDPLEFNSDESTDSDSNMPVLTLRRNEKQNATFIYSVLDPVGHGIDEMKA